MLFFKLNSRDRLTNKKVIILSVKKNEQFIMFQSTERNGNLAPPVFVKSIKKVAELMRKQHEKPHTSKPQLLKYW
jgi:hypothetical protein